MKSWTRSKRTNPIWICVLLMLAQTDAFAQNGTPCLSLKEVQGGYPRYRIIDGRHCWYASTRGPEAKRAEPKEADTTPAEPKSMQAKSAEPKAMQAKPADTDVNPYDDPIWRQPEPSNVSAAASRAKICEEQALKLDLKEKRAFMKQCMAN